MRSSSLSAAQRARIGAADTFFIASAHPEGGADASHRGGRPGFVRVTGQRSLAFPDYPGNNMFNTLGNLTADQARRMNIPRDIQGAVVVDIGGKSEGIIRAEEFSDGTGELKIKPGDRVVVSLLRSCGSCFFCARGDAHDCDAVFALDTESRLRNARGEALQHGIKVGAFAELAIVDQSQVVRVPDEIPLDLPFQFFCAVDNMIRDIDYAPFRRSWS